MKVIVYIILFMIEAQQNIFIVINPATETKPSGIYYCTDITHLNN